MTSEGVTPVDKFEPKSTKEGVIYTPKTPTSNGDTPVFQSVFFKPENIKEVTITPVDKNGTPVGQPKTQTVEKSDNPEKPVEVTFDNDKLVPSYGVLVSFAPITPGEEPRATVQSFIVCVAQDG